MFHDGNHHSRAGDSKPGGSDIPLPSKLFRDIVDSATAVGSLPELLARFADLLSKAGVWPAVRLKAFDSSTGKTIEVERHRTRYMITESGREVGPTPEEARQGGFLEIPIVCQGIAHGTIDFMVPGDLAPTDHVQELRTLASLMGLAIDRLHSIARARDGDARFRSLMEASPYAVVLTKLDGTVTSTNRQVRRLFGDQAAELLVGKNVVDMVAAADRAEIAKYLERLRAPEGAGAIAVEIVPQGGRSFKAALNGAALYTARLRSDGCVLVINDIVEQAKISAESVRSDKLESIGLLAGKVAHDFNNLLTAVITNLSLAQMDAKQGEETGDHLAEAMLASKQARALTGRLLSFARGGAPVKKEVAIKALIENTVQHALRDFGGAVLLNIAADVSSAEIDAAQVTQALEGIFLNAAEASVNAGEIEIAATNRTLANRGSAVPATVAPGRFVEIRVADRGAGIPKQSIRRIFDPFFTTKPGHSGLGLAVAHAIVSRHGGHLFVESEEGAGSVFTMLLPAFVSSKATLKPRSVVPKRGLGRILAMDDDPMVLKSIRKALMRLGYEVSTADDGQDALTQYLAAMGTEDAFDLVILDLTVPAGMGGAEAMRRLLEIDPDVKAVVSSGYCDDSVLSNYMDWGFMGMIAKPYDIDEIADTLGELIAQPEARE